MPSYTNGSWTTQTLRKVTTFFDKLLPTPSEAKLAIKRQEYCLVEKMKLRILRRYSIYLHDTRLNAKEVLAAPVQCFDKFFF